MATEDHADQKASEAREADYEKETCFTIMPFGAWFDQYYENIYKPAIESAGLVAHRADDLYRPSNIVHDIWEYTQNAKIILADLTSRNPNVFYELGLGHALAKPVILVAESIEDDVPFDLRGLRTIDYNKNNPDWGDILQERITTSIMEVLEAPLKSVLPTFLAVKDSKSDISVTKHEKEMLEIKQDVELLRHELQRSRTVEKKFDTVFKYSPSLARSMILRYLEQGVPTSTIVRELASRGGMPEDWVMDQIEGLSEGS